MKENLGPDLADETRENLDILRDTSQSEESRADAHVALEMMLTSRALMRSSWLVHSRNVNNVAQIRAAHNALANRKKTKRKHTECGLKRMRER
ncbi:hypothetical protein KUCAC02_025570 [Chaenocephalus aceratus]|uniref:Uncharacterized protein n=1 Tax=Chaenocephalus aceratus TaxID=36190 RepID=A0ACB9VV03_CHAAC|nr:hypothetical protein KUCAC02_025570 [Chaenocephalus aceratus]